MPIHEPFFRQNKGDLGLTKFTKPLLEAVQPAPKPEERLVPNVLYFVARDGQVFSSKEIMGL